MRKIIYFFLMLSFTITSLLAQSNYNKIDPHLISKYETNTTNSVIIQFKEQADVSIAKKLKTKLAKATFVTHQLRKIAAKTQNNVKRILTDHNVNFKAFFVINAIQTDIDLSLLQQIAKLPEVSKIINDADMQIQMIRSDESFNSLRSNNPEWGLKKIKADSVWLQGIRGEGVTIAGQDTGYEWDLNVLKNKYRGYIDDTNVDHNYNWHDAIHEISWMNVDSSLVGIDSILKNITYDIDSIFDNGVFASLDTLMIDSIYLQIDSLRRGQINPCGLNSPFPCDDHNHGSHTMGTMVGSGENTNIIGVAPGAKWIACRNMERGAGKPSTYIECFEWFISPTDLNGENPDLAKAPHVINNSWACTFSEGCNVNNFDIMKNVVTNVKLSGIFVTVSAGNEGPSCETVENPAAIYLESFSVGATNFQDDIASFSSRGAVAVDNSYRIKPNVTAPGVGVKSCIRNNKFANYSGTSMAGPHVAGAVALMISANQGLAGHIDIIEDILEATADTLVENSTCSGMSNLEVPNNIYGHGRINALKAVAMAQNYIFESTNNTTYNKDIILFPNPISTQLGILIDRSYNGYINLQLINTKGQTSLTKQWKNDGLIQNNFDVSQLPSGVYICKINIGNETVTGKIVKAKY